MSDHALSAVEGGAASGSRAKASHLRMDEVFSPSTPITRPELFTGRQAQVHDLLQAVLQSGQHAVVCGERGVGKTSLVTLLAEFASGPLVVVRVAADPTDTFTSLWRKAARGFRFSHLKPTTGFVPGAVAASLDGEALLPSSAPGADDLTPGMVADLLRQVALQDQVVIVFDEFDRVADERARMLFSDTIKTLSDAGLPVTIVLVGVAEDASGLVHAHPSIERSLVGIQVPRMSESELIEASTRMFGAAGLTADDAVVERIATLAQGLPHVVHLLGLAAARAAVAAGGTHLTVAHLDEAVAVALRRATDGVRGSYEQAIVRARRGIFPEILLACALTPRDARGRFSVDGVKATLESIVGREVRGLTNQVAALTESGRGNVLTKSGTGREARYRFVNPMLQPYILMRGLEQDWATQQTPNWLAAGPVDESEERRAA